jgi:hypothetical protein
VLASGTVQDAIFRQQEPSVTERGRLGIRAIAKIAAVWVKFEVWNIQTIV